jgi:PPOX class probable F420-dependent enzyme
MRRYHRPVISADAATLPPHVREFIELPHVATLATGGADGAAHQSVIWYRLEPDGRILLNSRADRRWPRDLQRDPRCSLAILDETDGFRWVGLTGVVETVIDDLARARADILSLATRYDDDDEDDIAAWNRQIRISFRVRIVAIHDHLSS